MAVDVSVNRETQRRRRLRRIAFLLAPIVAWTWMRLLAGNPVSPGWPRFSQEAMIWLPGLAIIALLAIVLIAPMAGSGRSPEVIFLPEQIDIDFGSVKGLGPVVNEVRHTLDVFLNHQRFRDDMGGQPRRGVLFEGPPGTGKTHTAKAMAKEAGVPFLFVSSTAFQSMWYGATARKIRAYFRKLRKIAREEGGAIGFIEEFDAIGVKRSGMSSASPDHASMRVDRAVSEGIGGVVNELLIQMQSFDDPPRSTKSYNWMVRQVNKLLPQHLHLKTRKPAFANVLLIGATNRADKLDPALLRPGRFDRILHFGVPARSERRELIDFFLARKRHDATLDETAREDIAATTMGYTPASLERLFDEALLFALRDGRRALSVADVSKARMDTEIGLAEASEYTDQERRVIATHEAGHAVVAHLVGTSRKLDLLSIVKRKGSLGLLAHSEREERFTRSRTDMEVMIQISFGGMVAEELFFGQSGTGPVGDLEAATKVAVEMVGSSGLGPSLISFRALADGPFSNMASKVLGDKQARAAVDEILDEQKKRVTNLLAANRHLIEALRDALLDRDELVDREIVEVIERAIAERPAAIDIRV